MNGNSIAALTLGCVLVIGSIALKVKMVISEPSLVILVLASLTVSLVVLFSAKVKSIDLKKGQLILQDVKQAESNIKQISLLTLDLIEKTKENSLELVQAEDQKDEFQEIATEIRRLAEQSSYQ